MTKYALETRNLTIGYRRRVNRDVVLAQGLEVGLRKGELVGLLGPNGVGKSTLLRTLSGMQKALAGRILLRGQALSALRPSARARQLSMVLTAAPQPAMMNGYGLVALGRHPHSDWLGRLSPADRDAVAWAIAAVGADDLAETPLAELSDGQRQKLMIARALAQEADIMLLDEPTAYLDLPRRVETMQLLKRLARTAERAILVSTHDLDLALRSCDQLWLMTREGIATGAPEDLVLQGTLGETFSAAGVSFDARKGTFVLDPAQGPRVSVIGEGSSAVWMRRALERVGYRVSGVSGAIEVSQRANGSAPYWHVRIQRLRERASDDTRRFGRAGKRASMTNPNRERGLVLVNTGDGRGKSTSAFGVILRMLGRKKRAALIQFLKHEAGQWGEVRALSQLGLQPIKTGDGFTWTSKDLDETQARALHGWKRAQAIIASDDYELVVLDEFTYLLDFGWLDTLDAIAWLRAHKPARLHLLITGRNAPEALIDYADTVTEMVKVKHAFDAGIKARAGIEF